MKYQSIQRFVLCFMIGGLGLSGCRKSNVRLADFKAWLMECPTPFVSDQKDPVLVTAGGVVITVPEFEEEMQNRRGLDGRIVLDAMIRRKIAAQLARESGVLQDPAYRHDIQEKEDETLYAHYLTHMPVLEEEKQFYYQKHLDTLLPSEPVISYIRMKSQAQAQQKQAFLRQGHARPGVKTVTLTRENAGFLGPEFQKIARTLTPGKISDPIKTDEGFIVARREVVPPISFEDAGPRLLIRLEMQKVNELCDQKLAANKMVLDEQRFKALAQQTFTAQK